MMCYPHQPASLGDVSMCLGYDELTHRDMFSHSGSNDETTLRIDQERQERRYQIGMRYLCGESPFIQSALLVSDALKTEAGRINPGSHRQRKPSSPRDRQPSTQHGTKSDQSLDGSRHGQMTTNHVHAVAYLRGSAATETAQDDGIVVDSASTSAIPFRANNNTEPPSRDQPVVVSIKDGYGGNQIGIGQPTGSNPSSSEETLEDCRQVKRPLRKDSMFSSPASLPSPKDACPTPNHSMTKSTPSKRRSTQRAISDEGLHRSTMHGSSDDSDQLDLSLLGAGEGGKGPYVQPVTKRKFVYQPSRIPQDGAKKDREVVSRKRNYIRTLSATEAEDLDRAMGFFSSPSPKKRTKRRSLSSGARIAEKQLPTLSGNIGSDDENALSSPSPSTIRTSDCSGPRHAKKTSRLGLTAGQVGEEKTFKERGKLNVKPSDPPVLARESIVTEENAAEPRPQNPREPQSCDGQSKRLPETYSEKTTFKDSDSIIRGTKSFTPKTSGLQTDTEHLVGTKKNKRIRRRSKKKQATMPAKSPTILDPQETTTKAKISRKLNEKRNSQHQAITGIGNSDPSEYTLIDLVSTDAGKDDGEIEELELEQDMPEKYTRSTNTFNDIDHRPFSELMSPSPVREEAYQAGNNAKAGHSFRPMKVPSSNNNDNQPFHDGKTKKRVTFDLAGLDIQENYQDENPDEQHHRIVFPPLPADAWQPAANEDNKFGIRLRKASSLRVAELPFRRDKPHDGDAAPSQAGGAAGRATAPPGPRHAKPREKGNLQSAMRRHGRRGPAAHAAQVDGSARSANPGDRPLSTESHAGAGGPPPANMDLGAVIDELGGLLDEWDVEAELKRH